MTSLDYFSPLKGGSKFDFVMDLSVEVIEFTRPYANSKNIFISGIYSNELDEAEIMRQLYHICSQYGLLYEVQVFKMKDSPGSSRRKFSNEACYYAFVKFYSHFAAKKAKALLSRNLNLGSQMCKVVFANRTKEIEMQQVLPAVKCQELANYYLGFNGWSSSIKRLEEDKDVHEESSDVWCKRFFCIIELSFPKQGLSTQGLGAWEEVFSLHDSCSKALAIHKARKCCRQRAMEHAFSKVLLIVLSSGKVSVEINTTKPDLLTDMQVAKMADEQVLRVTELTAEPEREDNQDEWKEEDGDLVLDNINLQILQELENDCG